MAIGCINTKSELIITHSRFIIALTQACCSQLLQQPYTLLLQLKFVCFLEVQVGNITSMHRTGSSKYLQLPAHDSSDIGKPSPLALLAATCQKIGAGSPSQSPKHRPRTPTPVLSHVSRPEQPMRQLSPAAVPAAPIRSPVSPMESTRLQSKSPAYELPLTPPSSPPQVSEGKASSPRITSVPVVPVSVQNGRVSYPAETPCPHPLQPVLHIPGLHHHHYSPYTMVVPAPTPIIAPYSGCVNQCYHAPHLPAVHPMLLPAAPLLSSAPISPPLSFGTYLHHDIAEARMSSVGKMRSRLAAKSAGHPLYRPYDFTKHPRRSTADEEIIDVVSV